MRLAVSWEEALIAGMHDPIAAAAIPELASAIKRRRDHLTPKRIKFLPGSRARRRQVN